MRYHRPKQNLVTIYSFDVQEQLEVSVDDIGLDASWSFFLEDFDSRKNAW